jgi:hypothetical protein
VTVVSKLRLLNGLKITNDLLILCKSPKAHTSPLKKNMPTNSLGKYSHIAIILIYVIIDFKVLDLYNNIGYKGLLFEYKQHATFGKIVA